MSEANQLPPAAVILHYQVADFDAWKTVFDRNEEQRKAAGILGHHINRAEGDPNELNVYFAVTDVDQFKAYGESDEIKALMQEAGVQGPPEFQWMTPLREAVVWDRELPAMLISHRVEDVDTWLAGYDDAAELQRSNGIIGHAANQLIDDPSTIVVYHQAESFDTLRAFMGLDELKTRMKEIGVTSDPEFTFHTGGWGKQY
jgi:hypothetical protein